MKKPFEGVRVLDFTQALAGVFCAMYMGDFGADVIKVERGSGDQSREWGPFVDGESLYFMTYNRNKRSVCIDLRSDEGRAIIMDLVKDCDVLLENFKYGTMNKLGLSYEEIKKVNPEIIYGSISGFGQQGPLKDMPCYDITASSRAGIMDRTGEMDGPPIKPGYSLGDNWTGLNFLFGVGMALVNKQATGKGCYLDLAMLDACTYLMEWPILEYNLWGKVTPRNGNHDAEVAPFGSFRAKDGWAVVAATTEGQWKKFCTLMNLGELADDPRFSSNELRVANLKELIQEIEKVTVTMNKLEIEQLLQSNRIPAGAVMNMMELLQDEHVNVRELAPEVDHPVVGKFRTMGIPIKFNKTPGEVNRIPAPSVGQHTAEVLKEIGYNDEKIAELKKGGFINN